ncbi:hypothetical protein DRN98_10125 [Methanosarcinales archaeon]|nr:MAG: hypothetical protein DRN98_10125 [Methanosarcinales archaeon]
MKRLKPISTKKKFIVGPRQCGKTTLIWLLIEEIKKQNFSYLGTFSLISPF